MNKDEDKKDQPEAADEHRGQDFADNMIKVTVGGEAIFVNPNEYKPSKTSEAQAKKRLRQRRKSVKLPKDPKPQEWKSEELSKNMIADYKPFNFVDGEGVRCSLYVSGCSFDCPGCYNVVAQNYNYGTPFTQELEDRIIEDLSQPYVQGLTLLGGEPFLNTEVCLKVVKRIRKEFGHKKDIWSWSGYTWDELMLETPDKLELLKNLDILVDGRFLEAEKDLTIQFRGSRNQRIIDVPASLASGEVKIWKNLVR